MKEFEDIIRPIIRISKNEPQILEKLSEELGMHLPTEETTKLKEELDSAKTVLQKCLAAYKKDPDNQKAKQQYVDALINMQKLYERYQDALGFNDKKNKRPSSIISKTVNQPKTVNYATKWNNLADSVAPLPREKETVLIAGHFEDASGNPISETKFYTAEFLGNKNWKINWNITTPNLDFEITHWQTINKNLPKT